MAVALAEQPLSARDAELADWLLHQGLAGTDRLRLLEQYCERLAAQGVPLMRFHLAQTAFHPVYGGIGFSWQRGGKIIDETYANTDIPPEQWLQSPFYHLLSVGAGEMRVLLSDAEVRERFPLFEELRKLGGVEYYARGLVMEDIAPTQQIDPDNPPAGLLTSWTTDQQGGFGDADMRTIKATLPYLGLALKSSANWRTAQDLLGVYLGADAGRRVLSGDLRRGSIDRIGAAICLFDLSGFTELTERLPGSEVVELLNAYFGVAVDVITQHGGHVLKFMGDGLLAVIDVGDDAADARAALAMVGDMQHRMQQLNMERAAESAPVLGFTIALHAGEVDYGNIGGEDRLDFTVIGSAVNRTARLSEMHKVIGQNVIVSDAIRNAARDASDDLVALGRYMLRGVTEPQELYTLHRSISDH